MKRSNSAALGGWGGGGVSPVGQIGRVKPNRWPRHVSGWQQVAKRGSSTRETRFLQLCALPSVANCWPPIRLMGSDSQRGSVTLSCNAKPDQQARGGDMRVLERSSEGNGDIDLERKDADRLLSRGSRRLSEGGKRTATRSGQTPEL